MKQPPIIIVAVDQLGGFGRDGKIPWQLPEDLQRFKKITTGGICVMGRITYEELLEARKQRDSARGVTEPITEILRGRESFVVTKDTAYQVEGAKRISDLGNVYDHLYKDDVRQIYVIGGRRLFIQALSTTNVVHMTIVKGDTYDCDVYFPIEVLNKKFAIVSGEQTDNAYYVVYKRK